MIRRIEILCRRNLRYCSTIIAFILGLSTHRLLSWRSHAEITSLASVLRSFNPTNIFGSLECGGSDPCCTKKVYDKKIQANICVRPYKQEFEDLQILHYIEDQRKGWLQDIYFSSNEHGLLGFQEHNLSSLAECMSKRNTEAHIAFIGDSHSRKRYLAITDLLGKGVGEEEV
jgi:hypothetical protein